MINLTKNILLVFFILFTTTHAFSFDKYGIIKEENINYRTKPGFREKIIGKIKDYEYVKILKKSKKEYKNGYDNYFWYKIVRKNRSTGWVYGKYITFLKLKPQKVSFYIKSLKEKLHVKKFDKDGEYEYSYTWENEYSNSNTYKIDVDLKNGIIRNNLIEHGEFTRTNLTYIYKFEGKKLKKIYNFMNDSEEPNISFYKNYIIVCRPGYYEYNLISIYDTKKINKKDWNDSYPGSCYIIVKEFEKNREIKYFNFDKENLIITVNKKDKTKEKINLKLVMK